MNFKEYKSHLQIITSLRLRANSEDHPNQYQNIIKNKILIFSLSTFLTEAKHLQVILTLLNVILIDFKTVHKIILFHLTSLSLLRILLLLLLVLTLTHKSTDNVMGHLRASTKGHSLNNCTHDARQKSASLLSWLGLSLLLRLWSRLSLGISLLRWFGIRKWWSSSCHYNFSRNN